MQWATVRRFQFTIIAVVIALVGALVYHFWWNRVPEGCGPVIEMLDFNQRQSQLIDDKFGGDEQGGVPSQAELDAYTAWADGLADRSGKVTDPQLVAPAVDVATAANDFVGKLKEISATPRAPGAPAPPAVYQLSILNEQITADFAQLRKACKR